MHLARWIGGTGFAALCAAGVALAPAIQAQERPVSAGELRRNISALGSLDDFTPAGADPKLAAVLARSGMHESDFRFTPSQTGNGRRDITVAVRASAGRNLNQAARTAPGAQQQLRLAPIAYNLGVSVGWQRFAVSGDAARVDISQPSLSGDSRDMVLTERNDRSRGRSALSIARPADAVNRAATNEAVPQTITVGGSYSIARNFDVTAGVRYERGERDRLPRLTDDRRDNQAVYIGTAFHF